MLVRFLVHDVSYGEGAAPLEIALPRHLPTLAEEERKPAPLVPLLLAENGTRPTERHASRGKRHVSFRSRKGTRKGQKMGKTIAFENQPSKL